MPIPCHRCGIETARDAFTLVELVVTVAIVATLAAFCIGALERTRAMGAQTTCTGNLRQWGVALHLYAADHSGAVPRRGQGIQPVTRLDRPEDWFNCLPPYLGSVSYEEQARNGSPARPGDKSVFVCPAAHDPGSYPHFICYGMNIYLSPWIRPDPHRLVELPALYQLAFMADAPGGWASTVPSAAPYSVQPRHSGRANVAFVDGHVETFSGEYLGCGKGTVETNSIRWQTLTGGINLPFSP